MCRFILLLVLLLCASASARPSITVDCINSEIDAGRVGDIVLKIENVAQAENISESYLENKLSFNDSDALCLVVEAVSRDARLKIVSEEIHLGTLRAGSSIVTKIAALAGEDAGIYPMDLFLRYIWLSGIDTSGATNPEVYFRYENATAIYPLDITVSPGPVLSLLSRGTNLEIKNLGDRDARNVSVNVLTPRRAKIELGDIAAGRSKSFKLSLTEEGEYPVLCAVNYTSGYNEVSTELATMIRVRNNPSVKMLFPVSLLVVFIYIISRRDFRRRLRR